MKIAVLSDSHDHFSLLEAAARDALAHGANALLHCGDVVAPNTLRGLQKYGVPVHVIHGNNTGDLYVLAALSHEPGSVIHYHGQDAALELAGRRIFMVHYPHYARAMALTGDWDMVCFGHEHRVEIALVDHVLGGKTLLIEPGHGRWYRCTCHLRPM
jgi:putative phosphoesterase